MIEDRKIQVVIPMTGYGSRFVNAGYKELKPLIRVMGKSIIEWIVRGMYSQDERFLFVCRKEHLNRITGMREYLTGLAENMEIVEIDDWVKKGPVFDVLRAGDSISDEYPVIINYCDFYMTWDWPTMKKRILERGSEGCVPCYTGFHPHLMIEKNVYASCLTDINDDLIEIREKYSFEKDKTKAKHSPGVYYFDSGYTMKKYCRQMVEADDSINGEYYASLPYNYMVKDGLKVWVPTDIDYFCQWGTPEDLEESVYWMNVMRKIQ